MFCFAPLCRRNHGRPRVVFLFASLIFGRPLQQNPDLVLLAGASSPRPRVKKGVCFSGCNHAYVLRLITAPSSAFCCLRAQARLLETQISNSAYHGASMDKHHIAIELEVRAEQSFFLLLKLFSFCCPLIAYKSAFQMPKVYRTLQRKV